VNNAEADPFAVPLVWIVVPLFHARPMRTRLLGWNWKPALPFQP